MIIYWLLSDVLSIVYYIFKIACIVDANSQSSLVGYRMAGRVISVSCVNASLRIQRTYVERKNGPATNLCERIFKLKKYFRLFKFNTQQKQTEHILTMAN